MRSPSYICLVEFQPSRPRNPTLTQPSRFDPYTSQDLDAALNDLMILLSRLIAKTHMNEQNPSQDEDPEEPPTQMAT
jgi:hypothetical protein